MDSFRLTGLDETFFQPYFEQPDEQLRRQEIRRVVASASTGFPCRISLEDAREGEELLLLPYCHHPVDTPYRASGPIYIRKGARRAILPPGVVPDYVQRRLISLRGYDAEGMLRAAEVRDGPEVGDELRRMFADAAIAYVQLHNARPGCFSCTATRVAPD